MFIQRQSQVQYPRKKSVHKSSTKLTDSLCYELHPSNSQPATYDLFTKWLSQLCFCLRSSWTECIFFTQFASHTMFTSPLSPLTLHSKYDYGFGWAHKFFKSTLIWGDRGGGAGAVDFYLTIPK